MDSTFIYSRFVTGKQFFSRKRDCTTLTNLLTNCENVAVTGPPKSGKMSLIQQALFNIRITDSTIVTAELNMLSIRDSRSFLLRYGGSIIRAFGTTPEEYRGLAGHYLKGTHLVFDPRRYYDCDEVLSCNWELDDADMEAIFRLPYLITQETGRRLYLILEEFQSMADIGGNEKLVKAMEAAMKEALGKIEAPKFAIIMEGSRVNAMQELLRSTRSFHRCVERFTMSEPDKKDIVDHISKGLLASGKVMDKSLIGDVCDLFRNNIWYINRFMSICDYLSKGYITESTMLEAMKMLLSAHEQGFTGTVSDLTTFQLSLLRAIIEGNVKFSSADVIRRYGLSSSANVKRLKEALCKKEILIFDEDDFPHIIDPLFEYWLKNYLFK